MEKMTRKKGLLERLADGIVVGDGGMLFGMEKRGYVKAGAWTVECSVIHPEAVLQLHRDFLRAGADVMQALTFYASDSRMESEAARAGNTQSLPSGREINLAAYRLAREAADEGGALVSVSVCETTNYKLGKGKDVVQPEFTKQLQFFADEDCDIDFIVCEYFPCIEEMEWAIEAAKAFGKPVVASMCIGPKGDKNGVPTGQCAIRMAKAGADVVGINCNFGPNMVLKGMRLMKEALDEAGLKTPLMCQPIGFYTPEVDSGDGYLHLPEHFLAYEPRTLTRFEAQKYAREAYEIGARYIGGCCAFEPHHIRAMSEELQPERQKVAPITKEFGDILSGIRGHPRKYINSRSDPEHWKNVEPHTGRPRSAAFSTQLYKMSDFE